MPGRKFPGCVVQGDTLSSLLTLAASIHSRAADAGDAELAAETLELVELIAQRLAHYEAVLDRHGIDLPYVRPTRA